MASTSLEIFKFDGKEKCVFCGRNTVDEFQLGKIYKYRNITVHYFCLLFASQLRQNGADKSGILGFLSSDIKREVESKKKSRCTYCHRTGATAFCSGKKCRIKFHFPCGLENNSFHLFSGHYPSYCYSHRRVQSLCGTAGFNSKEICIICQADVIPKPSLTTIWAACCKTSWFHKECIQKLALNAGYFFKCPNCGNSDKFRRKMLTCGIYIPDQDASWEMEPHYFQELEERYNSCDAKRCLSPSGRSFSRLIGPWKIILCNTCGSQGIHKECGSFSITKKGEWTCNICSSVIFSGIKKKRKPTSNRSILLSEKSPGNKKRISPPKIYSRKAMICCQTQSLRSSVGSAGNPISTRTRAYQHIGIDKKDIHTDQTLIKRTRSMSSRF